MAIPSSGSDGKDRLIGIFRYLSEGHYWDVILPSSHLKFTAEQLREIISGGIDGAIISARFENERSLKNIFRRAFGVPMSDYRRSPVRPKAPPLPADARSAFHL